MRTWTARTKNAKTNPRSLVLLVVLALALTLRGGAAPIPPGQWGGGGFGDQGDGTYVNPILPGDYQNTDVVRVGADYYDITATKALSPGMMVLHSRDLVNWTALGHVIPDITAFSPRFNYTQMDGAERGVWAGAIAHHAGRFYVYFTTPDEGIYVSTAQDPAGPWDPPHCLLQAAGWDDPCPFWDDDGRAYLVTTNFARDPANGQTYNIHLFPMSADGRSLVLGSGTILHQSRGSEANKLFKHDGLYYHYYSEVRPEGRVPMLERSKSLAGPWEARQLLHVNKAGDREPNQGTLLQTGAGRWAFLTHHGTSDWEGRPVSLLPATWQDGWPRIGTAGSDGIGNMVWHAPKPLAGSPAAPPQADDEFDGPRLSPQWEWYFQPRPRFWSLTERPGWLRLYAFPPLPPGGLLRTGDILTQRPLRADGSAATVRMDIAHLADGQQAGLCLLGRRPFAVAVAQDAAGQRRFLFDDSGARTDGPALPAATNTVWLRATWDPAGTAHFLFSTDGQTFTPLGTPFQITDFGAFLGARIGLYTVNPLQEAGYVDMDSFHCTYAHAKSTSNVRRHGS